MYALFFNCWTVSDTFYWWIGYWQEKEIRWSEKIWSDLSWYESHVFCDMFRWMKTKPRQSSECWWNAFVTSYTPNHSNRRRNKNRKLYRLKKNYKVTKYELVSRANEVPSLPDKRSLVCVSIELHLFRFRLWILTVN